MQTITFKKFPLNQNLVLKSRLLAVAGDQTRIRILFFMFEYKKACVSYIAESLGMGITCISHHLQLMRDNGFFTTERTGNNICYILQENELTDSLKKIISK